jgi:hypothetical protein
MRWILLVIFFVYLNNCFSQKILEQRTFRTSYIYHYGLSVPKTPQLNYLIQENFSAKEIRIGILPNPQKSWINQYNISEVGLAFYKGTLGNKEVLGEFHSVYPYISFRLTHWKNFNLFTSVGAGIGIASKPFHPVNNYTNKLIGSKYNAHLSLNLQIKYKLDPFNLIGGVYFSHISNGSTKQPNDGYNYITSNLGISVDWGKKRMYPKVDILYPKLSNEFSILWNHAFKEKSANDPHTYYISSLSLSYLWGLNSKQRLGIGVDLFYDESINRGNWDLNPDIDFENRFYQGVTISHDLVFNKFTFSSQIGVYTFYKSKPSSKDIYNRLALRYKFSQHLLINLGLKAYLDQSDYIEFGIGYYLNRKQKHEKS